MIFYAHHEIQKKDAYLAYLSSSFGINRCCVLVPVSALPVVLRGHDGFYFKFSIIASSFLDAFRSDEKGGVLEKFLIVNAFV